MGLLINGKPVQATEFAYDGCHKVYLIRTPEERAEMVEIGYGELGDTEILPIAELPRVWDETCALRFISSADLNEQFVEQCENASVAYIDEDKAPYQARRLQLETTSDLQGFTGWHSTELTRGADLQADCDARASFGGRTLAAGLELNTLVPGAKGEDDLEGALADLLCNLRHFADAAGIEYMDADRRASNWHLDEITGQVL